MGAPGSGWFSGEALAAGGLGSDVLAGRGRRRLPVVLLGSALLGGAGAAQEGPPQQGEAGGPPAHEESGAELVPAERGGGTGRAANGDGCMDAGILDRGTGGRCWGFFSFANTNFLRSFQA